MHSVSLYFRAFIFKIILFHFCVYIFFKILYHIYKLLRPYFSISPLVSIYVTIISTRLTRVMGFDRLRYCCRSILNRGRGELKSAWKSANMPIRNSCSSRCLLLMCGAREECSTFWKIARRYDLTRLRERAYTYSSPARRHQQRLMAKYFALSRGSVECRVAWETRACVSACINLPEWQIYSNSRRKLA